jgi:hypothetical protein
MNNNNQGLNLNIFSSNGSGQFGHVPLRVQADNSNYIPHETAWDTSIYGPDLINSSTLNELSINLTDFSVNKYDYHYGNNNGKNYINYDLQSNWYVDMIDMKDDIAVIGVKDWTSTEKFTTEYDISGVLITSDNLYNVDILSASQSSQSSYTLTDWTFEIDSHHPNYGNGQVIINYQNNLGQQALTIDVPHNYYNNQIVVYSTAQPTYTLTGDYDEFNDPVSGPSSGTAVYYPGGLGCGSGTYLKNDQCYYNTFSPLDVGLQQTITYFNIKNLVDIFQKPEFLNNHQADDNDSLNTEELESNTPLGGYWLSQEFPDYSDVFLKINYTKSSSFNDNIVILNSDTTEYIYKFGGFLSVSDYLARSENLTRSYLPFSSNTIQSLQDSEGYKWYIVYRETSGDYLFVTLSSYIIPQTVNSVTTLNNTLSGQDLADPNSPDIVPRYKKIFNQPSDNGSLLDPLTYGIFLIKNNSIYFDTVEVIKVANYPSCGKVDIYTKKMGIVTEASGNTITSSGHNLSTGDRIKISCGLGFSDINGFRYISGINQNKFDIYFDSSFTSPMDTSGLLTTSGVQWTAIGGSAWKYNHTLYSPNGKNGYGFIPQLRTVVESGSGQTLLSRAVETNKYEPSSSLQTLQSRLNSWISWTNFYPYQRIASNPNALTTLDNGNKFGSDCRIKKLNNNEYILMVSEPGAEVSFKIFEDYIIQQQTNQNPQEIFPIPENQFAIPTFLPYGKVHFYKITKSPYNIEYLNSTGVSNNPWSSYELTNQTHKLEGNISNSPIDVITVKNIFNNPSDNYWLGARYYSWNKNYSYDPVYGIEMPEQNLYINEYGFVDSFGKSAVFNIIDSGIYCTASTNVKSAGFTNNSRMNYVDATSKVFKYDLQTNAFSNMSGIVNQTTYTSTKANDQIKELQNYGLSLDSTEDKVFIGWSATYRGQEQLYIYDVSGINYNLSQTITSVGNSGFGNYFAVENDFIVIDSLSKIDDSGNTTKTISYINVYEFDHRINKYYYSHRISPTIDIGNYNNINQNLYTPTSNLSYDGTTNSSVTYLIDLYGKYDIYNDALVLRDYYEYAFFTYDGISKKFKCRNHHKILNSNNTSNLGILRIQPSDSSFAGSSDGRFITSLDVLDGFDGVSNTRIISTSYQDRKFLPLSIKTLEGSPNNSGLYFRISAFSEYDPKPTGVDLFIKQIDLYNSGLNLFAKQIDTTTGNLSLFISDQKAEDSLTLVISPIFSGYFPLTVKTFSNFKMDEDGNIVETNDSFATITTQDNFTSLSLMIDNHHTGVPNSSGSFNLSLKTRPYDDYGQGMNMTINYPFPENSGVLDLFVNNPSGFSFSQISLSMLGSDILHGVENSGSMNLFIKRIIEAGMPLTVYNTYSSGGLDLFTKGAYLASSGINLYTSGEVYPTENNSSIPIYVRGTRL